MDTLIKWPGGKDSEFEQVRNFIPPFQTYIEPFFGAGAFFFHLRPQQAIINDVNEKLIRMYRFIQQRDLSFERSILNYVFYWERMREVVQEVERPLLCLYDEIRDEQLPKAQIDALVNTCLEEHRQAILPLLKDFFGDITKLWTAIVASVCSKIGRLPKLERDNDVRFSESLMRSHVDTAVRAGLYTYLRDAFIPQSAADEIANFYFLREFCYGSMFRFNKDGKFNIPYGGIAYNKKDFRAKSRRLFSEKTSCLFRNAHITALDFRDFFAHYWNALTQDTFCFLDPPYDTEFSAYDNMSFTMRDQEALAHLFAKLPCKAMLIIKDTESILSLYRATQRHNSAIQIARYNKTYTYNTRGRNERETQHLIICNYALTPLSLFGECSTLELL